MRRKLLLQVNNSDRLNHLVAPDMFWNGYIQVFNAKKGSWIATIPEGQQAQEISEPEPPQEEKEFINPLQLSFF